VGKAIRLLRSHIPEYFQKSSGFPKIGKLHTGRHFWNNQGQDTDQVYRSQDGDDLILDLESGISGPTINSGQSKPFLKYVCVSRCERIVLDKISKQKGQGRIAMTERPRSSPLNMKANDHFVPTHATKAALNISDS